MGKVKQRKLVKKVRSQERSFPQVPLRELGWVERAVKEVLGGVGGCPAGETKVIWGPAQVPILTRKLSKEEQKPERSWESAQR